MKDDKGILIENFFYMLAYSLMDKDFNDYEKLGSEEFSGVRNVLAGLICKVLHKQLKRGLYRQYREEQEDMASPRGRIDTYGSILLSVRRQHKLSVYHEDLSENNLPNRILKTTIYELLRPTGKAFDLTDKNRIDLKKLLPYFSQVDRINPAAIPWSTIVIDRNYRDYAMLLQLCRYALESRILSENKADYRMPRIDPDEEQNIYEAFLRNYYAFEHDLDSKVIQMRWIDDGGPTLLSDNHDKKLLPVMVTDITLTKKVRNETRVLIIDAKYYASIRSEPQHYKGEKEKEKQKEGKFRSANLYQILTYVKSKEDELTRKGDSHRVAGLLMYAKTSEEIKPVSWSIAGNEIGIMALDLSKEFKYIRKGLDDIVLRYFMTDTRH